MKEEDAIRIIREAAVTLYNLASDVGMPDHKKLELGQALEIIK